MSQALFEVPFDPLSRLPLWPRNLNEGDFTLFDGSPGQGWMLCFNPIGTPVSVTVRVATSATIMTALKADPSILWLADVESPIKDLPVTAQQAQDIRDWLRDHGYGGAEFGQARAAIASARNRKDLVTAVLAGLHNVPLAGVELQHITEA